MKARECGSKEVKKIFLTVMGQVIERLAALAKDVKEIQEDMMRVGRNIEELSKTVDQIRIETDRQNDEVAEPSDTLPGEKPTLCMFYTSWCPFSQKLMPVWDQIKINMKSAIDVIKVDCEHSDASGLNIQAYPSIRLIYDDQEWDYQGPRTVEGLMAFVKEHSP